MFSLFKKKREKPVETTAKKIEVLFNDSVAKEILVKIKDEFGLDYERQEYITFRKLERFALKHEIYDFSKLSTMIEDSQTFKEELINMLTVGETYFYRELGHFEILSEHMEKYRVSKILCAPSSSGEEVYSILLYLLEKQKRVAFDILGIDINSDALKDATKACYSQRSVSKLSSELLNRYFEKRESSFCVKQKLKDAATFKYQNVFDDSFEHLGKFDIIFCRNMLIYFNDSEKKLLLNKFRNQLSDDGILFLGHADISFIPEGYTKKNTPNGSYYIKYYTSQIKGEK